MADFVEAGYERIAWFAPADGRPTHAARELPSGLWTSKLGTAEDTEHGLGELEGALHGSVVLVMKGAHVGAIGDGGGGQF